MFSNYTTENTNMALREEMSNNNMKVSFLKWKRLAERLKPLNRLHSYSKIQNKTKKIHVLILAIICNLPKK